MDREKQGKVFREEVKRRGVTPEEMQKIWKTLGVRKATMLGITLYNNACKICKPKMLKNTKMPLNEYCQVCQEMIAKEFTEYL